MIDAAIEIRDDLDSLGMNYHGVVNTYVSFEEFFKKMVDSDLAYSDIFFRNGQKENELVVSIEDEDENPLLTVSYDVSKNTVDYILSDFFSQVLDYCKEHQSEWLQN